MELADIPDLIEFAEPLRLRPAVPDLPAAKPILMSRTGIFPEGFRRGR